MECIVVWAGSGQNIPYFHVYRRPASAEHWELLGRIEVGARALGEFSFQDASPPRGASFVYGVTAVNYYGRESEITTTDPVDAP
jgi:hypothetical protein